MAYWTIPGHERHRPLLDVVPVQLHLAGDKLSTAAAAIRFRPCDVQRRPRQAFRCASWLREMQSAAP